MMMSDGMLSQDEIDALLKGEINPTMPPSKAYTDFEDYLSPMERDALGEIGNISMGSSATALSVLLNQKVDITTPTVSVIQRHTLHEEFPKPYVMIDVSYTEGFKGANLLVINTKDASIIANLMMGGDGTQVNEMLDDISLSAVQEAMNQMMGTAATSMSTIFQKRVDISPPMINMLDFAEGEGIDKVPTGDPLVKISFRMKIGNLIDSTIMQLLPSEFAKELVENLLNPSGSQEVKKNESTPIVEEPVVNSHQMAQPKMEVPVQKPVYHQPPQKMAQQQPMNVQPAVFSNFEPQSFTENEAKNLDILYDIPLKVTVELGRTRRSVKEILELSSGSIIELDKLAGEPVDILINNRLIAKGEVVVIDENFGVRVTDIVSKIDRVNKLR